MNKLSLAAMISVAFLASACSPQKASDDENKATMEQNAVNNDTSSDFSMQPEVGQLADILQDPIDGKIVTLRGYMVEQLDDSSYIFEDVSDKKIEISFDNAEMVQDAYKEQRLVEIVGSLVVEDGDTYVDVRKLVPISR